MNEADFKRRTKQLGLRAIRLVEDLPRSRTADVIGKQLLRSATSVGANYRAACRGRSVPDVIAKLGVVLEEADETGYWLEMLTESGTIAQTQTGELTQEADEIVAMTVASIKTLKSRIRLSPTQNQES